MRKAAALWPLLMLALLKAGCSPAAPAAPEPTRALVQALSEPAPEVTASVIPSSTATVVTATVTTLPEAVIISTETETPPATSIPSATPDHFKALTVDALADRSYGGGEISIVETLERNENFTRYLISYPSDGLRISGFMNVPNEGSKFPVAIVLHGYIPPDAYETLAYTQRYADRLAGAGYFVIHPNLRNYPPSDDGPNLFRTGMAVDVLNLIAIIGEQGQDPLGLLRRADAGDINLWGHSMGGGVALRVLTVSNDPAIKTAVLYGAMSGDERLNYDRISEWSGGGRGDIELAVSAETLDAISPINYLDRIEAAISIHHSDADDVVPLEWSRDLCQRLQEIGKPVECHTYRGAPHTFNGVWDEVFTERFIRFFDEQ